MRGNGFGGRLLALALLAILAIASPAGAADTLTEAGFRDPDQSVRPKFIWWWPGPAVDDAELRAETKEMVEAGFGGGSLFETPGLAHPPSGNPPEIGMWGTPFWADRVRTALKAGLKHDFAIDLQASSGWPWSSPAVTGENIDLSTQELAFGERRIAGGAEYVGPPPPPQDMDGDDRSLVAVTGARLVPGGAGPKPVLDPESAIDLTPALHAGGKVHWKVPPGDWILFGFWRASTRSTGNGGIGSGLLLDYLSLDATKAAQRFLDERLFDRLGPLTRLAGDTFHEDSLETFGARLFWTKAFLQEFRARRGYDLARYLPALSVPRDAQGPAGTAYDFTGSAGERIRRDYAQTLTELWVENHILPAREWANGHGLGLSGRGIGVDVIGINVVAIAKAYDVPDIDHITNSTIDWVRTTTSGARLSGANKAASELGDLIHQDYMITLRTLKRIGDRQLVGGANELQLHDYPYKYANGADWPSWNPYSSEHGELSFLGISEGFTPEIPLWRHLRPLADYFARAQAVLQAGRPVTDVAIYRDAYGHASDVNEDITGVQPGDAYEPVLNSALTRAGFGFDIVDPGTLTERGTGVDGGRLVVQRPGYRALVMDLDGSKRVGTVDNSSAMSAPVARRLVAFARQGLPIVFVGRFPDRGVSYRDPGREDEALREAVAELDRSPRVRLAERDADVPAALADLGVAPDLALAGIGPEPGPCGLGARCVYSVHRRTARGDYWFVWNAGESPARFTGSFAAGRRAPERWDLWHGDRRPIGHYRAGGGRVAVPIELGPLESTVIGFERPAGRHVEETSAEQVVARGGRLLLRSTGGGREWATLSDGRRRTVDLGALPAPVQPGRWDLRVEGAVRTGEERHDLSLTALRDWREIPELADTSGTGTYRTAVTLDGRWMRHGHGAFLELGRVEGGVQVRVNGAVVHRAVVPPPRLDVGPFLRRGPNRIEVELTTTLKNRLNEMSTHVPGYQRFLARPVKTQPYGLIGPVRLVPYAQRAVG